MIDNPKFGKRLVFVISMSVCQSNIWFYNGGANWYNLVADPTLHAYKSAYIGFDLWQVKSGTIFDNIIVTDSIDEAMKFAEETYVKDAPAEREAKNALDAAETEKLKLQQADIIPDGFPDMPSTNQEMLDEEDDEKDEL